MAEGGILRNILLVVVGLLLVFPILVYGVSQWFDLGFIEGIRAAFKKVFNR